MRKVTGDGLLFRRRNMKDKVQKARKILRHVLKEFEPTRNHAVGAGRELLLAVRSAVDAEINLLDAATKKKPTDDNPPTHHVDVTEETD